MNSFARLIALLVPLFLVASCSSGGGAAAPAPQGKPSIFTKVLASAPTVSCPNGGIEVQAGIDSNLNGLLDPGEVTSTQYVCNGTNVLVSMVTEPSGTNCASGGTKINAGQDANANTVLDAPEISSVGYVCNGANGTNGVNSLLSIVTEPSGSNCAAGGLKVTSWLDTIANGTLDGSETAFTNYVCNAPGMVAIRSITAAPAVVRPGGSAVLSVAAGDGSAGALEYQWSGPGSFGLATAASTTWSAPGTVGSYLVSVVVSNGVSTVTGYASLLVSASPSGPVITNVSPAEVRPGDQVLITGAGFGASAGSSTVTIGGTEASTIMSWSDSQVRAVVPAGAVTGSVVLTVGGSQSSPGYLVVRWKAGENVALTGATGPQQSVMVPDGSGGAIIVWQDFRKSPADPDIYVQRVSHTGSVLWTAGGVPVCDDTSYQQQPAVVSDGAGGAIIAWVDFRNGIDNDIYAQRITSAGDILWASNGAPIITAAGFQSDPLLVSDGNNGAIVVFGDNRANPATLKVYAQRVNGSGTPVWPSDVALASTTGQQNRHQVVPDGSGGAIVTWLDGRNSGYSTAYAQRISGSGASLWTPDGVLVIDPPIIGSARDLVTFPKLVPDGSGGAIIAWIESRKASGTKTGVYAQRIGSGGTAQWAALGVEMDRSGGGSAGGHQLISDGSGGAIVVWYDDIYYAITGLDLFAQRIDGSGSLLWVTDGIPVSLAAGDQTLPRLASDGAGGVIITWQDKRSKLSNDVYAQRLDAAGNRQWTYLPDGAPVATAMAYQGIQSAPNIISDGSGGAIIVWQDNRNNILSSADTQLYGQGITADGL